MTKTTIVKEHKSEKQKQVPKVPRKIMPQSNEEVTEAEPANLVE